ncbi:hypothetical protein J6590_003009 [Homalodisca vitripennis]|nr:hypothetical protein J6590_003009 [Homalodisca vitripennis]
MIDQASVNMNRAQNKLKRYVSKSAERKRLKFIPNTDKSDKKERYLIKTILTLPNWTGDVYDALDSFLIKNTQIEECCSVELRAWDDHHNPVISDSSHKKMIARKELNQATVLANADKTLTDIRCPGGKKTCVCSCIFLLEPHITSPPSISFSVGKKNSIAIRM